MSKSILKSLTVSAKTVLMRYEHRY